MICINCKMILILLTAAPIKIMAVAQILMGRVLYLETSIYKYYYLMLISKSR